MGTTATSLHILRSSGNTASLSGENREGVPQARLRQAEEAGRDLSKAGDTGWSR
jgi:hypothetical protein